MQRELNKFIKTGSHSEFSLKHCFKSIFNFLKLHYNVAIYNSKYMMFQTNKKSAGIKSAWLFLAG